MAPAARAPEWRTRIATASLALPVVGAALWFGAPASSLLFASAGAMAAVEYYRIVFGRLPRDAYVGVAATAALPLLPGLLGHEGGAAAAFWILAAASVAAWTLQVARGVTAGATERVGHVMAGMLFAGPGLLALALLREGVDGRACTFALLAVTWCNDAAAYAVGHAVGRHKLAPALSPGKTWEGALGGALGSAAATAVVWAALPTGMSVVELAVLCAGSAVVGPLGDLGKSVLKRAHGAKHSGRLFPGHGGLLDRIDAVLWNSLLLVAARAALGH